MAEGRKQLKIKYKMATEILVIGVGSAGVTVADKMDLPNSKKLYVDTYNYGLNQVQSEGEKILIRCNARDYCPTLYCGGCFSNREFCQRVVREYEDEIRAGIINAFE